MLNKEWKNPKMIATESTEDTEVKMGHSDAEYPLKMLCALGVLCGRKNGGKK